MPSPSLRAGSAAIVAVVISFASACSAFSADDEPLPTATTDGGDAGGGPDGSAPAGGLAVKPDEAGLDVFRGQRSALGFTLTRGEGFDGAVTLTVKQAPAGVTARGEVLAAEVARADLSLEIAEDTPLGASELVVEAASVDGRIRAEAKVTLRVAGVGPLDPLFGPGGSVVTAGAPNGDDYAAAAALQPDGKIVVAGSVQSGASLPAGYDFLVMRYDVNGALDPTFGDGGKVVVAVTAAEDRATAVAVLPDGSIVVGGHSRFGGDVDVVVVKLLGSGGLATTFGNNGIGRLAIAGTQEYAFSLAVQGDGKLVVFGAGFNLTSGKQDFLLGRFLTAGQPDNDFDGNGIVHMAMGTGDDHGTSGAVLPDGRFVLAGGGGPAAFAVARWGTDGQPDPAFGTNGKVLTPIGGEARGEAMTLQADGKMVVAGGSRASNALPWSSTIVRYLSDGTLDPAFGSAGIVKEAALPPCYARSVKVQSDGKIVVVGEVHDQSKAANDFAVWRYLPSGARDATFGSGGLVVTPLVTGNDAAAASVIQSDGKIVAVGRAAGTNGDDVALARLR